MRIATTCGNPVSGLLRLGANPGSIPAEPDKPRQDPDGTRKQVLQNPLKIWSERVPGASRITPGAYRSASERQECKKTKNGGPKNRMPQASGPVLAPFWNPAGSPKLTKNRSGDEKVRPETAPEAVFVGFSCRCHLESLSGPILTRFFTENHA